MLHWAVQQYQLWTVVLQNCHFYGFSIACYFISISESIEVFMKRQTLNDLELCTGTQEGEISRKKELSQQQQQWSWMPLLLKGVGRDRHCVPHTSLLHSYYSLDDVALPVLKLKCPASEH